ncbi:FCD domain-containing protein [Microbacterium sp.]|uniref:FadR/GntR family transcriptional regulator n=1 Tax=Microbacterium sp. TaxID=51671 RepID=UPI002811E9D1|nr:FCD domain-containing protein [Microbacterium sp.]
MRELSTVEEVIVSVLRAQNTPTGARTICRELAVEGFETSESTVNRLLTALDARGLTEPLGRKGRVLSADGRRRAEALLLDRHRSLYFERALRMESVDDLIDHLVARRGIEREASRAAALRATDDEIRQLQQSAAAGRTALHDRLDFHRAVGDASHNKQIQAIANTLFVERLDPLESVALTVGLRQGTQEEWENDHRVIAARIADRDPDAAEQAMGAHLDSTIRETEAFARSGWGHVLVQQLSASTPQR